MIFLFPVWWDMYPFPRGYAIDLLLSILTARYPKASTEIPPRTAAWSIYLGHEREGGCVFLVTGDL